MKVRDLVLVVPLLLAAGALSWLWLTSDTIIPARRPEVGVRAPMAAKPKLIRRTTPPLDNWDLRKLPEVPSQAPAAQTNAIKELQRLIPGVTVTLDPLSGSPSLVQATGRLLTPAVETGADPREVVASFVDRHSAIFGHDRTLLTHQARMIRDDVTQRSGLKTLVWEQELHGIPLHRTIFKANLTRRGELVSISSYLLPTPKPNLSMPELDAAEAVSRAAASLGDQVPAAMIKPEGNAEGTKRRQAFTADGLSDLLAYLTYLPMNDTEVRLGWDVTLTSHARNEMHRMVVDAATGEVLVRLNLTSSASDASYRVFADMLTMTPLNSPSPMFPAHQKPSTVQPPLVWRSLVTLTALDTYASPDGWVADGPNPVTTGNNVDAYADIFNTNSPGQPRPSGGALRRFDYHMNLAAEPETYTNASVVQLFYVTNWLHDVLYGYGFTETSGNFQLSNFGRGGLDNDLVRAETQDGLWFNGSNFSTPADGQAPRMQMYLWSNPTPKRDGALDSQIIVHEYVHGLSNRLVGGGVGISATPAQGMGEGWSDFYAIALLATPSTNVDLAQPSSPYAYYLVGRSEQNYYFGSRRYPYSTSFSINPLTLQDTSSTPRLHHGVSYNPFWSTLPDVNPTRIHNVGEVWCNALLEVRRRLIKKHGFNIGSPLAIQLVTDGMKLSPVNPTFLEARDAIIQADVALTGGDSAHELWSAFAYRGFGLSANMPSRTSSLTVTEAYDQPGDMEFTPTSVVEVQNEQGKAANPTSKVYTLKNRKSTPLRWSASKTQAWTSILPSSGTVAPGERVGVRWILNDGVKTLPAGEVHDFLTITDLDTSETQTRPVFLNTVAKPSITLPPESLLLSENWGGGTLDVAATGGPRMTYQWFFEGQPIPDAKSSSLYLNAQWTKAGRYTVTVNNNGVTTTSEPVQLAVVDTQARVAPFVDGKALEISLRHKGEGLAFQWMRGGVPLSDGDLAGRVSGTKTATLKIRGFKATELAAGALFSCRISLGENELVTGDYEARVQHAPQIEAWFSQPTMMTSAPVEWDISQLIFQTNDQEENRPTRYTIVGLPKGLTYDRSTGRITGVPKVTGLTKVKLTITAANAKGADTVAVTLPFTGLPELSYGKFVGLVNRHATLNEQLGSRVDLSITNLGSMSAKLVTGTTTRPMIGVEYIASTSNPYFQALLKTSDGKSPLLQLRIFITSFNGNLQGQLEQETDENQIITPFIGHRIPWRNSAPVTLATSFAHRYTASFAPLVTAEPTYPQGHATMAGRVSSLGVFSGVVRLQDGTPHTFSFPLSLNGAAKVYLASSSTAASLHGNGTFSVQSSESVHIDGTATYYQTPLPASSSSRSYKAGVPLHTLSLTGGRWTKPTAPNLPLGLQDNGQHNAWLEFRKAFIDTSSLQAGGIFAAPVYLKKSPFAAISFSTTPAPGGITFSLNLTTGEFQGSFTSIDPNPILGGETVVRKASYSGVMIERLRAGSGHFNLPLLPSAAEPDSTRTSILSGVVKFAPVP